MISHFSITWLYWTGPLLMDVEVLYRFLLLQTMLQWTWFCTWFWHNFASLSLRQIPGVELLSQWEQTFKMLTDIAKLPSRRVESVYTPRNGIWGCLLPHNLVNTGPYQTFIRLLSWLMTNGISLFCDAFFFLNYERGRILFTYLLGICVSYRLFISSVCLVVSLWVRVYEPLSSLPGNLRDW